MKKSFIVLITLMLVATWAWATQDIIVSETTTAFASPTIVPAESGGHWVVWLEAPGTENSKVVARRVNADNTLEPIQTLLSTTGISKLHSCTDNANGIWFVTSWGGKVYAQHYFSSGSASSQISITSTRNFACASDGNGGVWMAVNHWQSISTYHVTNDNQVIRGATIGGSIVNAYQNIGICPTTNGGVWISWIDSVAIIPRFGVSLLNNEGTTVIHLQQSIFGKEYATPIPMCSTSDGYVWVSDTSGLYLIDNHGVTLAKNSTLTSINALATSADGLGCIAYQDTPYSSIYSVSSTGEIISKIPLITGEPPLYSLNQDSNKQIQAVWKYNNKIRYQEISLSDSYPDLYLPKTYTDLVQTISGFRMTGNNTVIWGAPSTYVYSIEGFKVVNYGSDAGPFKINYYLSKDTIFTSDDYLYGTITCDGLKTLSVYTGNMIREPFPLEIEVGTYYIGVFADRNNAIPEIDETNNFWYHNTNLDLKPITVYYPPWDGNMLHHFGYSGSTNYWYAEAGNPSTGIPQCERIESFDGHANLIKVSFTTTNQILKYTCRSRKSIAPNHLYKISATYYSETTNTEHSMIPALLGFASDTDFEILEVAGSYSGGGLLPEAGWNTWTGYVSLQKSQYAMFQMILSLGTTTGTIYLDSVSIDPVTSTATTNILFDTGLFNESYDLQDWGQEPLDSAQIPVTLSHTTSEWGGQWGVVYGTFQPGDSLKLTGPVLSAPTSGRVLLTGKIYVYSWTPEKVNGQLVLYNESSTITPFNIGTYAMLNSIPTNEWTPFSAGLDVADLPNLRAQWIVTNNSIQPLLILFDDIKFQILEN